MKNIAPYQIFFPIGIFSSLLAVGIWFVSNLNWFSSPVIFIHSKLIVGGFLWSFIVGFLMTAIPKMTGTQKAARWELGVAVGLMFIQISQAWTLDNRWFYGTNIFLILFMLFFGGRRLIKANKAVPFFFSHIIIAMILALAGAYFHFHNQSFMGNHLYHVGAILLLVLGIGSRFFSFLLGQASEFENASKNQKIIFHASGLLLATLLYLAGLGYKIAYLALACVSFFYLLGVWKIYRASSRPSAFRIAMRIIALMIPLSFLMCWLKPGLYIAWLHLLFIGSFGMITYAVATRVTLAHGSYSLDIEIKSKSLWAFVFLLCGGMVSRILYSYADGLWKTSYLHLAATLWLLGVSCWIVSFAKKIIKPGDQMKPSC